MEEKEQVVESCGRLLLCVLWSVGLSKEVALEIGPGRGEGASCVEVVGVGLGRGEKNILGRWTRVCTGTNQEQTCILKGERCRTWGSSIVSGEEGDGRGDAGGFGLEGVMRGH